MNKKVSILPTEVLSREHSVSAKIILRVAPVVKDSAIGPRGQWQFAWSADLVPESNTILVGGTHLWIGCKPCTMSGRADTSFESRKALEDATRKLTDIWNDHASKDNAHIQYIEHIVSECETFFPDSKNEK